MPLCLLLHSFVIQFYSIIISKGRNFETHRRELKFACVLMVDNYCVARQQHKMPLT